MTITLDKQRSKQVAQRVHAKPKACWRNAYLALCETPSALYVEGWAWAELVFEHGWIEIDNAIIDPTLYKDPPRGYIPANRYTLAELRALLEVNGWQLPVIWSFHSENHLGEMNSYNQACAQAFAEMASESEATQ